jgi:phenylalanyl-tRNA synthetase alpha chain
METISQDQLDRALALRDLADPAQGPHAMQLVVQALESAVAGLYGVRVHRDAGPRVVTVSDNYDGLRYADDDVTRDRRYSHYVGDGRMLRSHTTARIPQLLRAVGEPVLLSVPGICYRRDVIDRVHVGQPHQHDLWLIRPDGPQLTEADLEKMIGAVVSAVLPGRAWETPASPHPYTLGGREIYAGGVEIGECGLAHPEVLRAAGLPATASGLAMGLGLDRLLMLVKGVPDIRLLRADDPRIASQMLDLSAYRPVSSMPPTHRDLSLAVAGSLDAELLGDRVRDLLGPDAEAVEEITVRSETAYPELPPSARDRMGMRPDQKNVLLRVVLRHPSRTLTADQANELRDRLYAGLHAGSAYEWTASKLSSASPPMSPGDEPVR